MGVILQELFIKGRAKINLSLDVLSKRDDGYHNVKMIMHQIDLYDEILLKEIESGILINTDLDYLPNDQENIAYKAAKLMIDKYSINKGVFIDIKKNIPVAAGLAGGSTDAASVMIGLNKMWSIGASKLELMQMSIVLGADVPFCILGGCALAEGIGEKLTSINGIDQWVVICKPNIRVLTAEVYKKLDTNKITTHPNTNLVINSLQNNDIYELSKNLVNVLETVTENDFPIIKKIKKKMIDYGAIGALMSGSGPTVFGLYKDYNKAKKAYESLSKIYRQTFLVRSYKGDD